MRRQSVRANPPPTTVGSMIICPDEQRQEPDRTEPAGNAQRPTTACSPAHDRNDRLGDPEDGEGENDEDGSAPREIGVLGDQAHPSPGDDTERESSEQTRSEGQEETCRSTCCALDGWGRGEIGHGDTDVLARLVG
jgi:hypothetical protein